MTTESAPPSGEATPPSFGEFAVAHLSSEHWDGALPVPAGVLREAADAYLFRFDKSLSASFIQHRLHTASAALAACTGASPGPTLRWLRRALSAASCAYFGPRWGIVPELVTANAPALARLRRRFVRLNELVSPEPAVVTLAPQAVLPLVSAGRPVMLNVYAQYCSKCTRMAPAFAEAARNVGAAAFFAAVDAAVNPEVRHLFNVDTYPTVMLLREGCDKLYFPKNVEHTAANLAAFARGELIVDHQQNIALPTAGPTHAANGVAAEAPPADVPARSRRRAKIDAKRVELGQWARMLERIGIDELDALVRDREVVVHMRIDQAIQCGGTSCQILSPRSTDALRPLCVLLGGGMGAGKTTAVSAVAETPFWSAHGSNVVIVEADAFKLSDPFFHALGAVMPAAARVVHADSIAAAETLFLTAVNRRRDVVFDGTLSWAEYARQTVEMLRDGEFEYERGPGYVRLDNGEIEELYWQRARRREVPVVPYRIELVAVTVDAETAVARGIVRQILEGRGVPVADQLKSHALFSRHFESYVTDLFDSVYLFDMTDSQHNCAAAEWEEKKDDDRSTTAEIIAMRPGILFADGEAIDVNQEPPQRPFRVQNSAAYSRFLRKKFINIHASKESELYSREGVGFGKKVKTSI